MANGFIAELRWRGLLQDSMPGVEEHLDSGVRNGYIGFDPTADSLHVGNLVQIMMLVHFQRSGHRPIALVGGATGMVGDPSGKKAERNLLDEDALRHNQACIKAQLERFLDFNDPKNPAELVNNYDWFKDMGFLRFIREVGKHITVNYMMAKDSVKNRLESGLSFTEFSYQLVQGYDFVWLNQNKGCSLQMGGSDQWGNITTGTELIRRMGGAEAYAITTPLITKADGTKFGKSESGNVWLDAARTSPFKFYQFWLNTSDVDASRYLYIFTTLEKEVLDGSIGEHQKNPEQRTLQKSLAFEITSRVHGNEEAISARDESERIFDGIRSGGFRAWTIDTWDSAGASLPGMHFENPLPQGLLAIDLVSTLTCHDIYTSRGEAKRAIQSGAVKVNGEKVLEDTIIEQKDLLQGHFVLVQKGKKNPFIISFTRRANSY